ncbi:MAG TPA: hypothetical protein VIV88_09690 [Gemmatimonadales bacterium]|jgi:hypothetical protein
MRQIIVLGTVCLAACGGGTSSGPQLPGVDHILLVMDAGTVFTGQVIPSDQLVSLVIDSTGTAISNATISLSASPGWTVHHDTLIAPTSEDTGTVTVTASLGQSSAHSAMQLSAVTNLKAHGPWTVAFGCQPKDTSYHVDSFTVAEIIDSIVHVAPAIAPSLATIWRLWYTPDSVTIYGHTGTTFVTSWSQESVGIAAVPDTLIFLLPINPSDWIGNLKAMRPTTAAWRYVMPTLGWCYLSDYDPSGYVINGRTATFSSP